MLPLTPGAQLERGVVLVESGHDDWVAQDDLDVVPQLSFERITTQLDRSAMLSAARRLAWPAMSA